MCEKLVVGSKVEKRETSLNSNDNLVDLSFYGSLKLKGMRQE